MATTNNSSEKKAEPKKAAPQKDITRSVKYTAESIYLHLLKVEPHGNVEKNIKQLVVQAYQYSNIFHDYEE